MGKFPVQTCQVDLFLLALQLSVMSSITYTEPAFGSRPLEHKSQPYIFALLGPCKIGVWYEATPTGFMPYGVIMNRSIGFETYGRQELQMQPASVAGGIP